MLDSTLDFTCAFDTNPTLYQSFDSVNRLFKENTPQLLRTQASAGLMNLDLSFMQIL